MAVAAFGKFHGIKNFIQFDIQTNLQCLW
jgi:hypothetical protein